MAQVHRSNRHVISALALALATFAGIWMGACGDENEPEGAADAAIAPDAAEGADAALPGDAAVADAAVPDAAVPDAGAAPAGHTLILGGVAHMPGNTDPLANCTACHGTDLRGGAGPSCYSCHNATDHTINRSGVMHRPGTTASCNTCHGPNNAGGLGPACSNCHR